MNAVKAGQAIPVRFSLGGDRGLTIFEGGYPATLQVACDLSGGTSTVNETTNAGNSSLAYDRADRYLHVRVEDRQGVVQQLPASPAPVHRRIDGRRGVPLHEVTVRAVNGFGSTRPTFVPNR